MLDTQMLPGVSVLDLLTMALCAYLLVGALLALPVLARMVSAFLTVIPQGVLRIDQRPDRLGLLLLLMFFLLLLFVGFAFVWPRYQGIVHVPVEDWTYLTESTWSGRNQSEIMEELERREQARQDASQELG